ncbi:MAG: hypothetical protein WDM87_16145 [Terracidiphilus sp.]
MTKPAADPFGNSHTHHPVASPCTALNPMHYPRSMSFQDFLGNTATVTHLRESIRSGRFPHSMILAGPRGAGKYTLALMLAQTVNCLKPTESDGLPDFCGVCSNCVRIAAAANLETLVDEAVAARDDLRETDQTRDAHPHPDPTLMCSSFRPTRRSL